MNYYEIIETSKAYADRHSDTEIEANLDYFIILVEARINRLLKTRNQTSKTIADAIDLSELYTLPADYRGMRLVKAHNGSIQTYTSTAIYEYCSAEEFERRKKNLMRVPCYSLEGSEMRIFPTIPEGHILEITYFQKVPPLNKVQSQNWMSEQNPDIYISGMMSEIEAFTKNYEVSKTWDSKLTRSIEEISNSDLDEQHSSKPMQIKLG